jgi:hypothetical protein
MAPSVALEPAARRAAWLLAVVEFFFSPASSCSAWRPRRRWRLTWRQWSSAAGALAVSAVAGSLSVLLSGQIVAGALWGCLLCASIGVARERGQPLATGRSIGALMATLAVAAMSRLGLVAADGSGWGTPLDWLPVAAWLAALLLLVRLPRA